MSALGKSVRLFLVDGSPGGLLTAEIMNWTGHVIAAPRSDLAPLLRRDEVSRTGIYLLLGEDPASPGRQMVYVGEGDDISKRLRKHNSEKTFWDRAVVLTSKDMNLTKAHARYLEARFITLATQANRATLDNGTNPEPINLPEADRSNMEFFIEQAKIVLPVLGINLLRDTKPVAADGAAASSQGETSPVFVLTTRGTDARAQEVDGEFVVREASLAYRNWHGAGASYEKLRQQLEVDGSLIPTPDDKHMRFVRDYVFSSPSAASAVVLGRNSNGRLEWKVDGSRQTYAQWQDSLLVSTAPVPIARADSSGQIDLPADGHAGATDRPPNLGAGPETESDTEAPSGGGPLEASHVSPSPIADSVTDTTQ